MRDLAVLCQERLHTGGSSIDEHLSPPTSGWHSEIWNLLQQHGQVDADEDGIVVFMNSYYIDHERHLHEDRSRPLRFDLDHVDWERQVRFMWEDLVDENALIEIVIVDPEPPFFQIRGTIAPIIVHQHLSPFRSACLTTAVIPADPDLRILEPAHSFEPWLTFPVLLQAAGVADICSLRQAQGLVSALCMLDGD